MALRVVVLECLVVCDARCDLGGTWWCLVVLGDAVKLGSSWGLAGSWCGLGKSHGRGLSVVSQGQAHVKIRLCHIKFGFAQFGFVLMRSNHYT